MLDKGSYSAKVTIPALMPGINFFPLEYHPFYSFVLTLGIVPDLDYDNKRKEYHAPTESDKRRYVIMEGDWQHIGAKADEATLEINNPDPPPDDKSTLVVSIGIRYGTVGNDQKIQQAKGAGSAKILGTVGRAAVSSCTPVFAASSAHLSKSDKSIHQSFKSDESKSESSVDNFSRLPKM